MGCFVRRFCARLIDYLLWGMLTVTVLGNKVGDIQSPSGLFYASFWVYLFMEAWLVSAFATTAGKYLLGIYIFDQNEKKLSFGRSLKRAFLVFGAGMGFFLPYVSLVLPLCAVFLLLKRRFLVWDIVVQDTVECVKPTATSKFLLSGFILFLATGYFITARIAFLYREPDFAAIEDGILTPYWEEMRPQLVEVLSEETVLTPQSVTQALEKVTEIQRLLQDKTEELNLIKTNLQKQFNQMSIGEMKELRQKQSDAVFNKLNSFLFSERMRLSLFENILEFFRSAEKNKYILVDDQPVFEDEEMKRQYDNYMMQLQTFLQLGMPDGG